MSAILIISGLIHNSTTVMPIRIPYNVISAEHIQTHDGFSYSASVTVMSSRNFDAIKMKLGVHKYFIQPSLFTVV